MVETLTRDPSVEGSNPGAAGAGSNWQKTFLRCLKSNRTGLMKSFFEKGIHEENDLFHHFMQRQQCK